MILFGSSPDALTQQNLAYDQLYSRANEANANAVSQAQMQQIQLALQQREGQQRDVDTMAARDFQASQNALDRQSHLTDITAQYGLDTRLRDRTQVEQDFRDASRDASSGALPADTAKLKQLYPHFDETKINQLFQIAGSASVARVQQNAQLADKNGVPPDPALVDAAGVPKGTDFEKQAHTIIAGLRAPYEQQFSKSGELADTGSRLQKLGQDQTTPPLPTNISGAQWWNPLSWGGKIGSMISPQVSQSELVQPSERVMSPQATQSAMAAFQQAMKAPTPISATPMVGANPAGQGYVSNVPANWAPAFGRTATAQAVPPIVPAPATPPPGELAYNTPADVQAAYQSGRIDRMTAKQILAQKFGMQ